MITRIVLLALIATCSGFQLQTSVRSSAVVRAQAASPVSPVMFGGGKKAAPKKAAKKVAKKVVKKAAKKVVKKAAPKKVAKKAAKKVVKKAVAKKGKEPVTNVGRSAQSFTSKFFSSDNWAVQAFQTLQSLPASEARDANGRRRGRGY